MVGRVFTVLALAALITGCSSALPPVIRRPDPTTPPLPTSTAVGAPWLGRFTVTRQGLGQAHVGTLSITHPGLSFEAVWSFDEQDTPGVGLAIGDNLAFSTGGRGCGVAVYERVSDNTWRGRRLDAGSTTVVSEQWTQVAAIDDVQGRYQVSGGPGMLVIALRGPVVQISGRITGPIEGVGLIRDNVLVVGTGGSGCGVIRYQRTGTGMQGEWTDYGTSLIGTDSVNR